MASAFDVLTMHVETMGGTVRLHTFDDGQTVYVTIPGQDVLRFTATWGDAETASEQALRHLRGTDIVLPPVVLRARRAELPAKELDPWGPERMTYDDELNTWRERYAKETLS